MTTTTTLPEPNAGSTGAGMYRDVYAHLSPFQRSGLREEYKHLRKMGVPRFLARGVILRTVQIVRCWH